MPKKQKLPLEEKVQLSQCYLKGEVGVSEVSQIARVDRKTIRRWITRYQVEGTEGYPPNQPNWVYSPELKQKAVQVYLSGSASLMEKHNLLLDS